MAGSLVEDEEEEGYVTCRARGLDRYPYLLRMRVTHDDSYENASGGFQRPARRLLDGDRPRGRVRRSPDLAAAAASARFGLVGSSRPTSSRECGPRVARPSARRAPRRALSFSCAAWRCGAQRFQQSDQQQREDACDGVNSHLPGFCIAPQRQADEPGNDDRHTDEEERRAADPLVGGLNEAVEGRAPSPALAADARSARARPPAYVESPPVEGPSFYTANADSVRSPWSNDSRSAFQGDSMVRSSRISSSVAAE